MPFALRAIRKSRWYPEATEEWLPEGEPPADSLDDLRTKSNQLSIWLIEDDHSNLHRVAAAMASRRDRPDVFEYRLVPLGAVRRLRLRMDQRPGDTADAEANERWHWDVSELTAARLVSVARCLWRHGAPGRILKADVEQLLLHGVRSGRLNMDRFNEKLAEKIRDVLQRPR